MYRNRSRESGDTVYRKVGRQCDLKKQLYETGREQRDTEYRERDPKYFRRTIQ